MRDLIDRWAALYAALYDVNPSEDMLFLDAVADMLENLPSAEPERKDDDQTKVMLTDLAEDIGHIYHRRKWVCQSCYFVVRKNDLYCGHCGKKITEWVK